MNGDKIRLVDKLDKQTKFVANDSLGSDETRWYLIHTCTSLTSSTPRTAAWHSEWTYIGNNITCRKKIDVVAVIVVFIHMNRILEMWNCRKSTERKTYACENDVRMTTARDWAEVLFRCCAYFRHDCVGLRAKYVCLCIYRWAREFKSNSTCMLKKLTIVSHQILLLVFFIDWFICISERIQYSVIELGRTFSIHLNCLLSK